MRTQTEDRARNIIVLMISMIFALTFTACGTSPHSRTVGKTVDDAWITSKVKSSLLSDNLVSGTDVSVETFQGKVMLSGFVDHESQRERAVEIAKSTEGVQQVVNKLEVKPSTMGSRGTSGDRTSGSGTFEEGDMPRSQSRMP